MIKRTDKIEDKPKSQEDQDLSFAQEKMNDF